MADTKSDGFESFVRYQMYEIDKAPEMNIWNNQPSGRSHDAKWSPSVKSSNRDGSKYIKAYNNGRVKKENKRRQRKGRRIKDF